MFLCQFVPLCCQGPIYFDTAGQIFRSLDARPTQLERREQSCRRGFRPAGGDDQTSSTLELEAATMATVVVGVRRATWLDDQPELAADAGQVSGRVGSAALRTTIPTRPEYRIPRDLSSRSIAGQWPVKKCSDRCNLSIAATQRDTGYRRDSDLSQCRSPAGKFAQILCPFFRADESREHLRLHPSAQER